ncbi:MAG: GGDEF domain-containing protein [Acidimicrobiales bacterium]
MDVPPRPERRPPAPAVGRRSPADTPDAAAFALGRPEEWVLGQVRRRGTVGFVAMMTAFSVVSSVVLVTAAMLTFLGADAEYLVPSVGMAAAVPALVAPPALFFSVRLVARLDDAGRLLRHTARTDPLTGVSNRRGFFDALDELRVSSRVAEIAMVDVDDFKKLNDRHGHAGGDRALCRVAEWLVELVGDTGTVARIGGDEFAYVASPDPARRLPTRQEFDLDGMAYSITIGRAVRSADEDPDEALVRADADLYRRKDEWGGASVRHGQDS